LALVGAWAFSQTLERAGIAHEVLGFTSRPDIDPYDLNNEVKLEERRLGRSFSRVDPIQMIIFKGFGEPFQACRHRFGMLRRGCGDPESPLNQNIDGESLVYAASRLLLRPEKRKVLIVSSDGMPACAAGDDYALHLHLKGVVKKLEGLGVETLGIGIMTEAVKSFYPKHIILNNPGDIPTTVMGELSRILLARR
jgi:hypothetical protein